MSTKKTLLTNKFNKVQKEPHEIIEEQIAEEDKILLEAETIAKKARKKQAKTAKPKGPWGEAMAYKLDQDIDVKHRPGGGGITINYLTRGKVGEILNELYAPHGGWSYRIIQLEQKNPMGYICVVEIEVHTTKYKGTYQASAGRDGSPEAAETAAFKRAASFSIPDYLKLWDYEDEK